MSLVYRQTISDELAALIDTRRGPLSIQDFTTMALYAACGEIAIVVELRAELERLHQTIRAFAGVPVAMPLLSDDKLSW